MSLHLVARLQQRKIHFGQINLIEYCEWQRQNSTKYVNKLKWDAHLEERKQLSDLVHHIKQKRKTKRKYSENQQSSPALNRIYWIQMKVIVLHVVLCIFCIMLLFKYRCFAQIRIRIIIQMENFTVAKHTLKKETKTFEHWPHSKPELRSYSGYFFVWKNVG